MDFGVGNGAASYFFDLPRRAIECRVFQSGTAEIHRVRGQCVETTARIDAQRVVPPIVTGMSDGRQRPSKLTPNRYDLVLEIVIVKIDDRRSASTHDILRSTAQLSWCKRNYIRRVDQRGGLSGRGKTLTRDRRG